MMPALRGVIIVLGEEIVLATGRGVQFAGGPARPKGVLGGHDCLPCGNAHWP